MASSYSILFPLCSDLLHTQRLEPIGFTVEHEGCLAIEEWVKGFTLLHSLPLCSDLLHLVSDPSRMGEAVVVPLDTKHILPHRLRRAGRGGFLSPLQLQY